MAEAWHLGWWAPLAPAVDPDELIDPSVHGGLLAAVAAGSPLDHLGQARLATLKGVGLAGPDGRPRFPVARAEQAKALRAAAADLGRAVARLVAGEWSRLEVEYEPVHATRSSSFLMVGGLLLDLGVRRLLRRQGLSAPPFGSAFVWLAEGEREGAGVWFARATPLAGRGYLVRCGRPTAPEWTALGVDPEAAPAIPADHEPALRELTEGFGWSVVRLVEDALPALDPVRRRIPGTDDEGAFLAWAYTLAVDAALEALTGRGLVAPPLDGALAVRVTDPALAGL
ncbi:MAG TPA: hypothetical protein VF486_11475 [Actinomycetes bacterium]